MTAPAIEKVMDLIVERLLTIRPTIEPGTRFQRSSEIAPAENQPTKGGRRKFDLEFQALGDLSAMGMGIVNPGLADRKTRFAVEISYPYVGGEHRLEKMLASDSEHLLRSFNRALLPAPIQSTEAEVATRRLDAVAVLVLSLTVRYRDQQ